MIELLSPAGDMEALRAALRFGADAVYVGGPRLQLRAARAGFDFKTLAEAVQTAHAAGKRLYVAVNAFMYDADIAALGDYARALSDLGADAVIAADIGAIATIRRAAPTLDVHLSTQANCLNAAAARVYADLGVKRIVPGRELTLEQIASLHGALGECPELEVFVHGAMCMAYSGRCMMSAFMAGRSANRGGCAQSCRWRYRLEEETRPGQFFPLEEDERGMTILSSMDLNALPFLDKVIETGVSSLKIEGRMKTAAYVATVTNAYRRRLDALRNGTDSPALVKRLMRELNAVSHRPYSSGFYFGELRNAAGELAGTAEECRFVGTVEETTPDGWTKVLLRNKICTGDLLEIVSPHSLGEALRVEAICDDAGQEREEAREPGRRYSLRGDAILKRGDLLRLRLKRENGGIAL